MLVHAGEISSTETYTVEQVARSLQDFIICIELLFFAIAHHKVFSFNEFKHRAPDDHKPVIRRMLTFLNPVDMVKDMGAVIGVTKKKKGGGGGKGGGTKKGTKGQMLFKPAGVAGTEDAAAAAVAGALGGGGGGEGGKASALDSELYDDVDLSSASAAAAAVRQPLGADAYEYEAEDTAAASGPGGNVATFRLRGDGDGGVAGGGGGHRRVVTRVVEEDFEIVDLLRV